MASEDVFPREAGEDHDATASDADGFSSRSLAETGPSASVRVPEDEVRFFNRELSWLAFNMRVLEECRNRRYPLLERLRFLSISGSNLDEFFMVRVAGLKGQVEAGVEALSDDGLTPAQQLSAISQKTDELMYAQQTLWAELRAELHAAGINVLTCTDLSCANLNWLEDYFLEYVFPVLTPLAIDPAHPFPFLPNLGFSLILELQRQQDGQILNALVPLPTQVDRFIRLPGDDIQFVALEELLRAFLPQLFPGYDIMAVGAFRIKRDSDNELEEEAEDLVL
ncbi:MAG: hypothetical protein AAGF15_09380, partial [Pseudomonadota bacterium]